MNTILEDIEKIKTEQESFHKNWKKEFAKLFNESIEIKGKAGNTEDVNRRIKEKGNEFLKKMEDFQKQIKELFHKANLILESQKPIANN